MDASREFATCRTPNAKRPTGVSLATPPTPVVTSCMGSIFADCPEAVEERVTRAVAQPETHLLASAPSPSFIHLPTLRLSSDATNEAHIMNSPIARIFLCMSFLLPHSLRADVRLPAIFSEHMVLMKAASVPNGTQLRR